MAQKSAAESAEPGRTEVETFRTLGIDAPATVQSSDPRAEPLDLEKIRQAFAKAEPVDATQLEEGRQRAQPRDRVETSVGEEDQLSVARKKAPAAPADRGSYRSGPADAPDTPRQRGDDIAVPEFQESPSTRRREPPKVRENRRGRRLRVKMAPPRLSPNRLPVPNGPNRARCCRR